MAYFPYSTTDLLFSLIPPNAIFVMYIFTEIHFQSAVLQTLTFQLISSTLCNIRVQNVQELKLVLAYWYVTLCW